MYSLYTCENVDNCERPLKTLMPWHKKLSDIDKLWHDFPKLMEQMKQEWSFDISGRSKSMG